MLDSNSNNPNQSDKPATGKPSKPYPDFPLTAHPSGQWCKKIRGRLHYFGVWADPDAALASYDRQKEDLHSGRKPREAPAEGTTVIDVCNAFLKCKKDLLDDGELSIHTWAKYKAAKNEVIAAFGMSRLASDLGADDFADLRKRMAKRWGFYRLGDMIQHVRSIFNHAHDPDVALLPKPTRFGKGFKRPSRKTIKKYRGQQKPKLFTASEVRRMIDAAATPSMRAMLFLGINAGFGNSDCANLPAWAVDLNTGIIDFPRPKTGEPRRCALWPETVEAIKEALAARPEPKAPAKGPAPKGEKDAEDAKRAEKEFQTRCGLVFLTRGGNSWAATEKVRPISKEAAKLLKALGINGRKGLGFYTLRHTFRTVADETKDQPAIFYIMGHEIPDMSSMYREKISDARLRAVSDYVRQWLFPSTALLRGVE